MSHHAPCDYDRTISLFGLRVCVRCLGMLVGALIGYSIDLNVYCIPDAKIIAACIGLMLPAAFDFAGHELISKYQSTNIRRFATGGMFGLPVGIAIECALNGWYMPTLYLLVFLVLMQLVIASLFRFNGKLESYVEKYARAAIIDHIGPKTSMIGSAEEAD